LPVIPAPALHIRTEEGTGRMFSSVEQIMSRTKNSIFLYDSFSRLIGFKLLFLLQ